MKEKIFDLDQVKNEIAFADWEEDFDNPRTESRRVFIGTVFALMPSGKYYTPFACSNVTEEEAEKDEEWREQAEEELSSIGLCLESGEGDPCDLFIVEYRDREEK